MGEQLDAAVKQATPCPRCAADIPYDERFTKWCTACDWNVDQSDEEPPLSRFEAARRRLAPRHGEQLHRQLLDGGPGATTTTDRSHVLARAVALAVHAVTAVLAVGGALLVVLGRPRYLLCAFGAILSTAAVAPWPRWPSTS